MFSKELAYIDDIIITNFYLDIDWIIRFLWSEDKKSLLENEVKNFDERWEKYAYIFLYTLLFSDLKDDCNIQDIRNLKKISIGSMIKEGSLWSHSFLKYGDSSNSMSVDTLKNNIFTYFKNEDIQKILFNVESFDMFLAWSNWLQSRDSNIYKLHELFNVHSDWMNWEKGWIPTLLYLDFYKNINALWLANIKFSWKNPTIYTKFTAKKVSNRYKKYECVIDNLIEYVLTNSKFKESAGFKDNFWYIFEDFLCLYGK